MKAINLICRRKADRLLERLSFIERGRFESCCWALGDADAQSLVGGWVYLHPAGKRHRL